MFCEVSEEADTFGEKVERLSHIFDIRVAVELSHIRYDYELSVVTVDSVSEPFDERVHLMVREGSAEMNTLMHLARV